MDSYTTLGAWIKDQRKEIDITQDDLAKQVGCAISTIRKIEIGLLRPSREMAIRIAKCLEIADDLIDPFTKLARTPIDVVAPSPPAATARQSNVPVTNTLLIGREQDIAYISDCLLQGSTRLITLVGPPGIGKTRLAIEVANHMMAPFANNVVFVALESVPDATLVLPAIADELHITEEPGKSLIVSIQNAIATRRLLLVLDNVEHVLGAATDITALLGRCPLLTVLATGQEILHLSYEQQISVLPLPTPPRARKGSWQTLEEYPAVAFFVTCARQLVPTFALTAENAPAVAEICSQLDGIPLAIQLIASRIKLMSPLELQAQLDSLTSLVLDQKQARSPRQHTLRSAIAWSYHLLSVDEQHLFHVLGVFAGGCTLDALETISSIHGITIYDVSELLSTLLDKSMTQYTHTDGSEPRFTMLTMLREYALEQLTLSDGLETVYNEYARYYRDLAETASAKFRGPEERLWIQRLAADHDNIRAILTWTLSTGRADIALQIGSSLWRFWEIHNHISEGRRWLTRALAVDRAVEPKLQAKAYHAAGTLAVLQADNDQAVYYYEQSLALRRELQDTAGMAATMLNLATVLYHRSEYARAEELLTTVLDHYLAIQNIRGVASVLTNMGMVVQDHGQPDLAEGCYSEALAIQIELENQRGQANLLGLLGTLAQEAGEYSKAKPLFVKSLQIHRSLGLSPAMVTPLDGLGYVALAEGDRTNARAYWHECLTYTMDMEQPRFIVQALESCAFFAGETGRALAAASLWSTAAAIRASIDAPAAPIIEDLHNAARQRAQIDCEATTWQQAWEQGAAMSLDQAVALALRL